MTVESDCRDTYINPAETGFYYLGSRYYNPVVGRFISADEHETLIMFPTAVRGKNLYVYANNNPINLCDSGGFFAVGIIVINVITSAVAKTVLGEEYTFDDTLQTILMSTIGIVMADFVCGAALLNGFVSGVASLKEEYSWSRAIGIGITSAIGTYLAISNVAVLCNADTGKLFDYAGEVVFGFSSNLLSTAVALGRENNDENKVSTTCENTTKNTVSNGIRSSGVTKIFVPPVPVIY